MKIGRITISDRASTGVYEDRSGPEIERVLRASFGSEAVFVTAIIPDERARIAEALRRLVDEEHCALVVTTGGTGIGPRDVTPEATREVLDRELPGFGEIMRARSFAITPTAVLSRAIAGVRSSALIIHLPGKPRAVAECLEPLWPAVREALELLAGRDPHVSK